jgi:hypothetical protein
MSDFYIITAHTKAITPPFEVSYVDATTHDGRTMRFQGADPMIHGRNLVNIKYQGCPVALWISGVKESSIKGVDIEVPPEEVVVVLPEGTKHLKEMVRNQGAEKILRSMKKRYPMLRVKK